MCEWCENIDVDKLSITNKGYSHMQYGFGNTYAQWYQFIRRNPLLKHTYLCTQVFVGDFGEKYNIFDNKLEINYCPMCGRKLVDE